MSAPTKVAQRREELAASSTASRIDDCSEKVSTGVIQTFGKLVARIADQRMILEGFVLTWKVPRIITDRVELVYKQPVITRGGFLKAFSACVRASPFDFAIEQ